MSLANEDDMSETGEECIMVTGDFCGGEEEVICVETANGERVINADGNAKKPLRPPDGSRFSRTVFI